MIYAYVAMILGVATPFVPSGYRPALFVLVLAAGAMYVRSAYRRGAEQVDKAIKQAEAER